MDIYLYKYIRGIQSYPSSQDNQRKTKLASYFLFLRRREIFFFFATLAFYFTATLSVATFSLFLFIFLLLFLVLFIARQQNSPIKQERKGTSVNIGHRERRTDIAVRPLVNARLLFILCQLDIGTSCIQLYG